MLINRTICSGWSATDRLPTIPEMKNSRNGCSGRNQNQLLRGLATVASPVVTGALRYLKTTSGL